jgi:hypothetical protein
MGRWRDGGAMEKQAALDFARRVARAIEPIAAIAAAS